MKDCACPRCPKPTLTQFSMSDKSYKCFKCNVKWRVHNTLYCLLCDYPHTTGITMINSMKDGLINWIVCDGCEALIHEKRGTAKRVEVVEYIK